MALQEFASTLGLGMLVEWNNHQLLNGDHGNWEEYHYWEIPLAMLFLMKTTIIQRTVDPKSVKTLIQFALTMWISTGETTAWGDELNLQPP